MLLALDDINTAVVFVFLVLSSQAFDFADDISLLADSELDLQSLVDKVNNTRAKFGLQLSSSKTEVQAIGRDAVPTVVHVTLGNSALKQLRTLSITWVVQLAATPPVIDIERTTQNRFSFSNSSEDGRNLEG